MNRREVVTAGATLGVALAADVVAAPSSDAAPGLVQSGYPNPLFPTNNSFWFETLRTLGNAEYAGSSIGEVIAISHSIKVGDYDSWYNAYNAAADRLAKDAAERLARGLKASARDGMLRASTYYRTSEFYLHGNPKDPRINRAYKRQIETYKIAAGLFDPPVEPVEIPYEGTTLPGYFHRPDASGKRRPTIVIHTGFDGSAEENHFLGARAGVERGFNVLSFDGPGQSGPLHREGLTFRSDWEKVVTPVVDFLVKRRDVDAQKIALHGISLGGLLAPRAAAFEHRIAALIADDGMYDASAALSRGKSPAEAEAFLRALQADHAPEIDALLERQRQADPTMAWAFAHGMWAMGASSPRKMMAKNLAYHLRDGIAEKIKCPTLVLEAEGDVLSAGQAQALYDHLTCKKTFMRFTSEEGAGAHCEMGAARLAYGRMYDWVTEAFAAE
jgi:dienelactone hydrolase